MENQKVAKKLKDGSFNDSRVEDPDEVFTESLKSPDCVNILFSCIENVEILTPFFENKKKMKDGEIKAEKEIAELMEVIEFISNKFGEYEKDRKEKEESIKN